MSNPGMAAPSDDDTGAAAPAPDAGDQGDDSQNGPTVLLTVMDNHDGSYTVLKGDEDSGTEPGDGAADDAADGGDASDAASQGQTCNSVGEMLKAVMGIAKDAEGGGGAQGNFQAGFDGGSGASPAKAPPMAQKY